VVVVVVGVAVAVAVAVAVVVAVAVAVVVVVGVGVVVVVVVGVAVTGMNAPDHPGHWIQPKSPSPSKPFHEWYPAGSFTKRTSYRYLRTGPDHPLD
jgi:hypothetical protein